MKVFKFGGASIKSANAIKNVAKILNSQDVSNCLLVISAMGKMTNAFEKITDAYFNNDQEKLTESIDFTSNFHFKISISWSKYNRSCGISTSSESTYI